MRLLQVCEEALATSLTGNKLRLDKHIVFYLLGLGMGGSLRSPSLPETNSDLIHFRIDGIMEPVSYDDCITLSKAAIQVRILPLSLIRVRLLFLRTL